MSQLTQPSPNVEIGQCPHCGKTMTITPVWYQFIARLVKQVNANTP